MNQLFNDHFWSNIHGGSTHFPVALIVASVLFDLVGHFIHPRDPERSRELHAAGFYSLLLGAVSAVAAVVSGLRISRWETLGKGTLGLHHLYVWPAFTLLVGLALWRLLVRNRGSRKAMALFVVIELTAAVMMLLAGYQGGEMVPRG